MSDVNYVKNNKGDTISATYTNILSGDFIIYLYMKVKIKIVESVFECKIGGMKISNI